MPGEREPASERRAPATRAARSAGRLPVQGPQRGRSSTSARRPRSASASPVTSRGRSSGEMVGRITSIDFLVTETEAEALLAEQQFIKRHRPSFNIRLRDDKSYPYIGISLDEEFPRVYFTRERHRSARIYFGPYSSAKRVRETLDLLGKLFQYRTCEGPRARSALGRALPRLLHQALRRRPCVGYIDREEYRRNIDAIVDFLSGRYRDVERDLERKMGEAADAEEFERAAVLRDRLEAVRSLMERRSVASDSLESADLVAVAVEGRRGERAGVPGPRRGARRATRLLLGQRGRARRGGGDRGVPRPVLLGGAGGAPPRRRRAGDRRACRARRRGALGTARRPGRGAGRRTRRKRRLRELAARNASLALAQDRLRRSADAASASMRSRRFRTRSASSSSRSGSRASTSPTSAPSTRSPRWSSSRAARRRRPTTGAFASAESPPPAPPLRVRGRGSGDLRTGPNDSAAIEEVLTRRVSQLLEQADRSPHDADRDDSFAALPDLIVIDGGRGQLSAGMRVPGAAGRAGDGGDRAREAARGGLPPGRCRAAAARRATRRRCACCSGSVTRPTGSRSSITASAATRR